MDDIELVWVVFGAVVLLGAISVAVYILHSRLRMHAGHHRTECCSCLPLFVDFSNDQRQNALNSAYRNKQATSSSHTGNVSSANHNYRVSFVSLGRHSSSLDRHAGEKAKAFPNSDAVIVHPVAEEKTGMFMDDMNKRYSTKTMKSPIPKYCESGDLKFDPSSIELEEQHSADTTKLKTGTDAELGSGASLLRNSLVPVSSVIYLEDDEVLDTVALGKLNSLILPAKPDWAKEASRDSSQGSVMIKPPQRSSSLTFSTIIDGYDDGDEEPAILPRSNSLTSEATENEGYRPPQPEKTQISSKFPGSKYRSSRLYNKTLPSVPEEGNEDALKRKGSTTLKRRDSIKSKETRKQAIHQLRQAAAKRSATVHEESQRHVHPVLDTKKKPRYSTFHNLKIDTKVSISNLQRICVVTNDPNASNRVSVVPMIATSPTWMMSPEDVLEYAIPARPDKDQRPVSVSNLTMVTVDSANASEVPVSVESKEPYLLRSLSTCSKMSDYIVIVQEPSEIQSPTASNTAEEDLQPIDDPPRLSMLFPHAFTDHSRSTSDESESIVIMKEAIGILSNKI